jgi:EmrB/QacA subfamily drug resistance transporter
MDRHGRLVPLIVASPMFLQNVDTSGIATALPRMAEWFHLPPLLLNLVLTVYAVSIAVFLPLSAWLAERFGARRVFCAAIILFSLASALSALATSLGILVACRVLQGLGAALMLPVSRVILLRSVPASALVGAMTWFTVPPVLGRLMGPLIGGAIVSVASWQWIFLINVPLGLLSVALTLAFVDDVAPAELAPRFDAIGFALMAIGLAALLAGLEGVHRDAVPLWITATACGVGVLTLAAYGWHSRRLAEPVLDLRILRYATFRTNLIGAAPLRLALLSAPVLLPLMLQLGFGLSPLMSGLLTAAAGIGSIATRGVIRPALTRFGFRRLLLVGTAMTTVTYMSYALFRPSTPVMLMFAVFFAGGTLTSLCMVSLNTLAYADVPQDRMSHAAALTAVAQQLIAGGAVVLCGLLLALFSTLRAGGGPLLWEDFAATFVALGLTALLSFRAFGRLPANVGDQLR